MSAGTSTGDILLETRGVAKRFGGLAAVAGLELRIGPGDLVGLIGPNGAGKTTVFNLLTGVYTPSEGQVIFAGRTVNGLKPFQVAGMGIARTFQNIRLFPALTALDNVRVAAHLRSRATLGGAVMRTRGLLKLDHELTERSLEYLDALNLAPSADSRAGDLAYGLQRRLEIARALATRPRLLLLDEPAAGMNPQEKSELMELIAEIRSRFALTVLLIEHDMKVVMGICQRIYVLDYGQVIAEGTPAEIRSNPRVIAAYLGEEAAPC